MTLARVAEESGSSWHSNSPSPATTSRCCRARRVTAACAIRLEAPVTTRALTSSKVAAVSGDDVCGRRGYGGALFGRRHGETRPDGARETPPGGQLGGGAHRRRTGTALNDIPVPRRYANSPKSPSTVSSPTLLIEIAHGRAVGMASAIIIRHHG
jgi:hypothetical protein